MGRSVRDVRRVLGAMGRLGAAASGLLTLDDAVLAAAVAAAGRGGPAAGPPAWPDRRLPLQRLEEVDGKLRPVARYALVPPRRILYFFTPAATRWVIHAKWARQLELPAGVYARTDKGLFLFPAFRSLAELRRELRPPGFVSIHESLMVNADRVELADGPVEDENLVGVEAGGQIEWLQASRREYSRFRRLFPFPRRRPSARAGRRRRPASSRPAASSGFRPDRVALSVPAQGRRTLLASSEETR